ncbi:hypothetical protein Aduo_019668 [Ancylostoma duodenale]
MAKVADTLVEAGHDVTIYSPNIHPDARSPSTKAHVIDVDFGLTMDVESAQKHVWKSDMASYLELGKVVMKPVRALSEILYGSQQFHSWIKHQKFDLFVSEGIASFDTLVYLSGIKKYVNVVSTNPLEVVMQWMGVPNTPSYVPVNNKGFSVPMTYLERAQNFLELAIMSTIMQHTYEKEFEYIDKAFGPITWSMQKQAEQCSYIFVNNDEVLDFPRATTPKFHYIGGLRRQLPKPLDPKWEKVFASAKRGVILMSFGTMARSTEMGERRQRAFTKAFETFPDITFIWRYENTSGQFTNASNIVLHDWLPQVDMLNDERMLAFITHGGMGGVFESAYAGVPVITIPLFADQLRNARMMEYRRVGVVIDKDDVTEDRLISAITEILQPRYKQAAEELSEQLQNKPFTPEEILVRHMENAIRFNVSDSLTSIAGRQSFIEYYMLDTVYSPNIHPDARMMATKAHVLNVDVGLSLDLPSAQRHVWKSSMDSYIELAKITLKPTRELANYIYGSDEFQSWVREQNFDLAISEGLSHFDALLCMCGVKKFVITTSTNPIEYLLDQLGIPNTPSFVPVNNKGFSVPMTYLERAQNLMELVFVKYLLQFTLLPEFSKYLEDKFGSAWTLEKQADTYSYIFVNNDEMIDFPRVTTHKYHYIGGLRMPAPKPLSPEWEKVYASAKRGVILMSFGTMARSTEMGEERRTAFVNAFKAFPDITFIWRYENTSDRFTDANNIVLHDWLPQVDMLNDKRTLAFITHGGMGGVFESAYAGVPVITIPLFADQLRNARMMEYRGMGVVINKDDVTKSQLTAAINEVLKPRYKEAAGRLSDQLRSKPFSPEEVLVRHIEHAIRFNVTASLNNVSNQQTFIEYYMLDIIIPFIIMCLLIVTITLRLVYHLISFMRCLSCYVKIAKVKQH